MLDSHAAYLPLSVELEKRVLVKIARLDDVGATELDVERISIFEVTKFHGRNERSKNALWTVLPSGKYNAQPAVVYLSDTSPAANSAIPLRPLVFRIGDHALDPLKSNRSPIAPLAHVFEVMREPHSTRKSHRRIRSVKFVASAGEKQLTGP